MEVPIHSSQSIDGTAEREILWAGSPGATTPHCCNHGSWTGAMKLLPTLSPPLLQPMVLTPIPAASPSVGQRPAHATPAAAGILVQASLAAVSMTGPTATSLSSPVGWATLQFGLLPDPGLELYGTPWSDVSRQACLVHIMPLYLAWRGVQQDSWCLSTMRS